MPCHRAVRLALLGGRRRASVIALALGMLAGAMVDSVHGASPGQFAPRPLLRSARLLISAPVGNKFHAHLWDAPSTAGGVCSFVTTDHFPKPQQPPTWNGGGECSVRAAAAPLVTPENPLLVGLSVSRRLKRGRLARWVPPIVHGTVRRGLRVARVQIEWRGGIHRLRYRNGHFLGGTTLLYMPPFAAFPFFVVAYDRTGREVTRKKLESPALRLMRGGWRQYAREYNAWKQRHR
jgi:hypothetical protein